MRDPDIRAALNAMILAEHGQDPATRVVEEMPLCRGRARIDLAVINGELNGYEIKSAVDTLTRLRNQAPLYSEVFDRVTIVVSECHLQATFKSVPPWWGIQLAMLCGDIELRELRIPGYNDDIRARSLVELLWRDEAIGILERRGFDYGVRSKPKKYLWNRIVDCVPPEDLRREVREALKLRCDWRADPVAPSSARSGD
jgi:hypothetical protein